MGRKNFRRLFGKSSVMYCVRVEITFVGETELSVVYLRFRTHPRTGSPWTQDPCEAKFWLYKSWPYSWLNMENPNLKGEVICLQRDNAILQAQKSMR